MRVETHKNLSLDAPLPFRGFAHGVVRPTQGPKPINLLLLLLLLLLLFSTMGWPNHPPRATPLFLFFFPFFFQFLF
jgi:hypothetical protein